MTFDVKKYVERIKSIFHMQIETIFILNQSQEILYYAHSYDESVNWNDYFDRLISLLPPLDSDVPSFLLFDDIAIGTSLVGSLRIILTAPLTSNLAVDKVMASAVEQITKILTYICKDDISQQTLMKRDNYISLKLLLQAEISVQGHMHFITEFDQYAKF